MSLPKLHPSEHLPLDVDLGVTMRELDAADPFGDRCRAGCGALADVDSDLCRQCSLELLHDLQAMEEEHHAMERQDRPRSAALCCSNDCGGYCAGGQR